MCYILLSVINTRESFARRVKQSADMTWKIELTAKRDMIETVNHLRMINQPTSQYRLILGGEKKRRRNENIGTNAGKTKIWNMQINGTIKGSGKMEKGREMKGGVKKFGKPTRTLASELELPWFLVARGSIWISKSSVIKCSFRVAVRFYEWSSLVNRPRRRWPNHDRDLFVTARVNRNNDKSFANYSSLAARRWRFRAEF